MKHAALATAAREAHGLHLLENDQQIAEHAACEVGLGALRRVDVERRMEQAACTWRRRPYDS
jgi:hypothetical protein